MAVLVEALSVIIRQDRLEATWPEGVHGYIRQSPNDTCCSDGYLTRVGFMAPDEAREYVKFCETMGLTFLGPDGSAQDLVVVDQVAGLLSPCDWLQVGTIEMEGHPINAARWVGDEDSQLFLPDTWSLTQHLQFRATRIQPEEPPDYLEYQGERDGLHLYLDTRTGETRWMTRPIEPGQSSDFP